MSTAKIFYRVYMAGPGLSMCLRRPPDNGVTWNEWAKIGPQTLTDVGGASASHTHTSAQISDALHNTTVGPLRKLSKTLVTSSMITYWNGQYSSTASNLAYCKLSAFGTMVTKNAADYSLATHMRSNYLPLSGENVTFGTGTITVKEPIVCQKTVIANAVYKENVVALGKSYAASDMGF